MLHKQINYRRKFEIERQEATFEDTIWFYLFPPKPVKFHKVSDKYKVEKANSNLVGTSGIIFPHYELSFSLGSDIFQYR